MTRGELCALHSEASWNWEEGRSCPQLHAAWFLRALRSLIDEDFSSVPPVARPLLRSSSRPRCFWFKVVETNLSWLKEKRGVSEGDWAFSWSPGASGWSKSRCWKPLGTQAAISSRLASVLLPLQTCLLCCFKGKVQGDQAVIPQISPSAQIL